MMSEEDKSEAAVEKNQERSEFSRRRVGIIWKSNTEWHGGQIYLENLVKTLLRTEKICPVLITQTTEDIGRLQEKFPKLEVVSIDSTKRRLNEEHHLASEQYRVSVENAKVQARLRRRKNRTKRRPSFLQRLFRQFRRTRSRQPHQDSAPKPQAPQRHTETDVFRQVVQEHHLEVVFPFPAIDANGIPGIGWIPDFQHRFLPQFFTDVEREQRDKRFAKIAALERVVVSSETCRRHFCESFPDSHAEIGVWRFSSKIDDEVWALDPESVRLQYRLPDKYFIVSNQFWKHKDHMVVIEAMENLIGEGGDGVIVLTGALKDNRGQDHIDKVLQSIQTKGLHNNFVVLGFMSRAEQIALMRRAHAVIQPSRFEGWSTVVEDCRAIGQRVIASNIDVHLEQDLAEARYFPVGDAIELAKAIKELSEEFPDVWEQGRIERERSAQTRMKKIETESGERLVSILLRSDSQM